MGASLPNSNDTRQAIQGFHREDGAFALSNGNLAGPQILVTDENRAAYRELAGAGLMIPLHTFAHGDELAYRR